MMVAAATDRPILFNGAMVRAILAGKKTQTRRIIKPQPEMVTDRSVAPWRGDAATLQHLLEQQRRPCPYGKVGDRLWVRETWGYNPDHHGMAWHACYRADPGHEDDGIIWKPSIHMPRAACRLKLEITSVRVERLQDISEEDAKAEGAWPDESVVEQVAKHFQRDVTAVHPSLAFRMLWESINGAGSWDANPWLWVVEFKRAQP